MESRGGRMLLPMLLGIHLLWILAASAQGPSAPNHEDVIDLLAALNMSHQISGVARLHSPAGVVYRIRARAPHLTLPREYSHFLHSNLHGSMGVRLEMQQAAGSRAALFSLSSPSSPSLQIVSSTLDDTLRLDYRAGGGGGGVRGLASFPFPGRNPLSREEWVQLAVSLEPGRLVYFVDCEDAVVVPVKKEETFRLELPRDVVVTLASVPGRKDSKFSGLVRTAEISMKAYLRRPWHCDNVTDDLPLSTQHTDAQRDPDLVRQDASTSTPKDQSGHYLHDVQSDQMQRGVVLGPPGFPQGVKSANQKDDRLRKMETRLEELARMLDMVKAQNAELQSRVQYLEGCECVRRRCVWEGREVADGQRWQADLNTVCTCTSGKVTCQANIRASLQMVAPPPDPCLSSPCQNGGVCFTLTFDPKGFHCCCPPDTKGPVCEKHLRQACWAPKPDSNCEGVRPVRRQWAYNPTSGLCEDFPHCSGNSSNSFPSSNACRNQCVLGACCVRKLKQGLDVDGKVYPQRGFNVSFANSTAGKYGGHDLDNGIWYSTDSNLTDLELEESLKKEQETKGVGCSEDLDFTYTCDYLTQTQCQALAREQPGRARVVSFSPGQRCSDVRCGGACGCFSQHKLLSYGEKSRQGCEKCVCTRAGRNECVCSHLTQRKEIRDLTLRERSLYQRAVRKLYAKPAVWRSFALLRAEFSPQAGDPAFFLPWHRYFLRLVERELQLLSSCKMAIPYFEWTVDSGSMQSSAAWQSGLFGGDGEAGSGCVQHHPFKGWTPRLRWSPCLRRNFNLSVSLPDAVTIQKIVNQPDFLLFSQSLQTVSGLFRLWVGGHMASPLAAYDPLYLSHMAFMDNLWTRWQEKHQHVLDEPKGDPKNFLSLHSQRILKMKPFDVAPDEVASSRQQMCVVFVPITIGAPCNLTALQMQPPRKYPARSVAKDNLPHSGPVRTSFDSYGFDQYGYDREGYDKSGWDRWGFSRDGFNRDLIDREGYDISGFNRYGFNRSNVTSFGMTWDGVFTKDMKKEHENIHGGDKKDHNAHRDFMSQLFGNKGYNIYGFDPFGLDLDGFDVFGFRTDGYDKDSCNWFFNGPHYLRFYFHTQQQLMSSSDQALSRITRTCPPVTSLPRSWAAQEWMTYDLEENNGQGTGLKRMWVQQNQPEIHYTLMEAVENSSIVWLPNTPDDRFCFKLYWFSGCPLGFAPIPCPDLCHQARCRGYPSALCHMHNCGSCFTEWRDEATGNHVICHSW